MADISKITLPNGASYDFKDSVVRAALANKAEKALYGDTTINVGRDADSNIGSRSAALGYGNTASGANSFASGYMNKATAQASNASGYNTEATGLYSKSEGLATRATNIASHAGGQYSYAIGKYSFSHGDHTKSINSQEASFGKYNKSSSDTLFSVGDGTDDSARHNAFEITATGGKLHDKDIATTDKIPDLSAYVKTVDVPNIKVNAAVDADTVGGKDPEKMFFDNGISSDLDSATKSGCYAATPDTLNAPSSSWWLVDTMNFDNQFIVQKAHLIGGASTTVSYIRNYTNGAWSDWTEMYTSGNKPYVSGSATVATNSTTCTSNHGFIPSAVIWWDGNDSGVAIWFNETQFAIKITSSVGRTISYLIFK